MRNRKILLYSGILFTIFVSFQNCAKKNPSNEDGSASENALAQAKSVALLTEKCSACHSGTAAYANAVPGNDPITDISNVDYLLQTRLLIPGEPDISPLFQMIQSAEMPPGQPLSVAEVDLIKTWIADFNKEETTGGGGVVTTPLAPNFSSLRVNVFLGKCYGCHVNRGVKLDTFASVSGAITNNNLRGRVNNNTMPPAGAPPLTAQEKTYLLQWIDAGAMNN
jgi:uncharacterized membrane protein